MNKQRKSFKFILMVAFSLVSLVSSANASAFRVLFIGNSFTGFSKPELERFKLASNLDDEFGYEFIGGIDLFGHLNRPETLARIQNGQWDYVVLQDHSLQTYVRFEKFTSAITDLAALVRETGAEPILFQTFARLESGGYRLRQVTVNQRYRDLGETLNIHVMAVGEAWLHLHDTNLAYFNRLHQTDRIHQTPLGATIVAGALYKTLYDTDLSWAPMESVAKNAVLQTIDTRPAHLNGDREREQRRQQAISMLPVLALLSE